MSSFALPVEAPFNLRATVALLQRRANNPVDRFEGGAWQRLADLGDALVPIRVENTGTTDAPGLRLAFEGAASAARRRALAALATRVLGLARPPAPLEQLVRPYRDLHEVGRWLRGVRAPRFASLFEAFVNVVPFQQVSLESGIATATRLVAALGPRKAGLRAFPRAADVLAAPELVLRECGLSAAKIRALRSAAEAVLSGALDEETLAAMPVDAALARLEELPGIGPWSAGLVLLRGLGRLEVFPTGDVGVARALTPLLGRLDAERAAKRAGEQRGYLYFLALGQALWRREAAT